MRFGGAEHAHVFGERRCGGELAGVAFRCVLVGAGDEQAREPPERRIMRALAQRDLGIVEVLAILLGEIPTVADIVGYVLIFAASVCVLLPSRG